MRRFPAGIYRLIPFILVLAAWSASASAGTVRLVSWNLLNWPNASDLVNDTSTRCPYFRAVMDSLKPSLLVTCENQSTTGVPWFLQQVLNVNTNAYRQGVYIQGVDSNNGIFYLDSLFTFVRNRPIRTALRDISEFTMLYKPTGDTFRIYAVHLKASSGSTNEQLRAAEVDSLRKVTNALPAGSDFIVCGDFNIYGDYEPAYQNLVRDNPGDDGDFVDPLNITGVWNNPVYSIYHTQSTRATSVGGGAGGGLDDRFDMILYSNAVAQAGGMMYVPGSCQPFGNDGNHFSRSINFGTNGAVPQALANALYYSSDHLPVTALFEFGTNPGIEELEYGRFISLFPNPVTAGFQLRSTLQAPLEMDWKIFTADGRLLEASSVPLHLQPGVPVMVPLQIKDIETGLYRFVGYFDKNMIIKNISFVK
ncbi:MAG: hypothetical protein RL213_38 [Bacteroidota bacterium]|jgi:hypothetical protein